MSFNDEQEERLSDDGSAEWCDDCHGYTHKYDCPSKRRAAKTPIVDQIVDAVYRSMARYESGEWWLDTLKAKARVNRLLNKQDTSMRDKCVEAIKSLRATPRGAAYNNAINDAIHKVQSLTLDQVQEKEKP